MGFPLTNRVFPVHRSVLSLYGLLALALSLALLLQSRLRGRDEFLLWLAAYAAVAVGSLWRPRWAPLAAGAAALLLGIVKTHCAGPNLDLGLSLIALSVGAFVLHRSRRVGGPVPLDPAGLALLLVSVLSLISLAFALARIRGFAPAPGFDYHVYPFNPLRLTSDEALIRTTVGSAAVFCWFGLYEYARLKKIPRSVLRGIVGGLLLLNAVVLVVQQHVDPFFLLHAGRPIGRFNGVTSYCYALGDVMLALFLLLPAWGARRGPPGLLTAAALALIAHAVHASGSRTAVLTMAFVTVLWAAPRVSRLFRRRPRLVSGLVLGGAAVTLALATGVYRVTPADLTSPIGRLKFGIERDGVLGHLLVTRLSSYQLIGRVLAEYPLSGVGVGLYGAEVSKQHALLAPDVVLDPFLLKSFAPNQFLNVGVELGVPALLGLLLAFLHAGAVSSRAGDADIALSLLALAVALQLAPSFYTSEALLFFWLIIGRAARSGALPAAGRPGAASPRVAAALFVTTALVGLGGQLLARSSLDVDHQWSRLRWPMRFGLYRPDEGGRWTRPQATFMMDAPGGELRLRWHAGDPAMPDYRTQVRFYLDGDLVERSIAGSGLIRESSWKLPGKFGPRRVSVRVDPPFVSRGAQSRDDPRRLGIFLYSP